MTNLKRRRKAPVKIHETSFRHPVTGATVRCSEDIDVELLCMRLRLAAGETGGALDNMERIEEQASQSAQNRARIARKTMGGSALVLTSRGQDAA